jgi:hypothetical protein
LGAVGPVALFLVQAAGEQPVVQARDSTIKTPDDDATTEGPSYRSYLPVVAQGWVPTVDWEPQAWRGSI